MRWIGAFGSLAGALSLRCPAFNIRTCVWGGRLPCSLGRLLFLCHHRVMLRTGRCHALLWHACILSWLCVDVCALAVLWGRCGGRRRRARWQPSCLTTRRALSSSCPSRATTQSLVRVCVTGCVCGWVRGCVTGCVWWWGVVCGCVGECVHGVHGLVHASMGA